MIFGRKRIAEFERRLDVQTRNLREQGESIYNIHIKLALFDQQAKDFKERAERLTRHDIAIHAQGREIAELTRTVTALLNYFDVETSTVPKLDEHLIVTKRKGDNDVF